MLKTKSLTPHEYNKATKRSFTGRYNNLDQKGLVYLS